MQTTMLIAQNNAPLRDMGAATGAATFLRNMGGSLGVSVLGALYTSRLSDTFTANAGTSVGAENAGGTVAQMTPQALRDLPESVQHPFAQAVSDGIDTAFAWGAGAAVIGIVLALFIRHVPLRGFGDTPTPPAPAAATTAAEGATAS
ncbi:hypothetical protein [Streptomyces sp. NPDC050392]|uniref:hypothetical protein n=1 Tax=Streptomyces sp. NPDC050392 TaxID=3155782 RepID=UPI0034283220